MNKKAVVLLSGGLDSTVTLYYAVKQGYEANALTVCYGQRHAKEIEKAKETVTRLCITHHIIDVPLPWKGSSLIDQTIPLPVHKSDEIGTAIPSTYVPGRNSIFLSLAASWAETIQADAVFIGANQLDYSGYPDCRTEYFSAFEQVVRVGTKAGCEGKEFSIIAPLLHMNKKEIVLLGKHLHVAFENTWSCYAGGNTPCNSCDSCVLRQKGFSEAGLEDPLR